MAQEENSKPSETVLIELDWDSGPYTTFREARGKSVVSGGQQHRLRVIPTAMWIEYQEASAKTAELEDRIAGLSHA